MKRREFFKAAAVASATLASGDVSMGGEDRRSTQNTPSSNAARLPRREYGATGVKLSTIGLGGLVLKGMEQPKVNRLVAEVVERGLNYFDVAPTYGDSELRLGPALEPYRKNVFLACKTTQRQREPAQAEFEQSLRRLRTDYIDVYQLHSPYADFIYSEETVEALESLRKEGKNSVTPSAVHFLKTLYLALMKIQEQ